MDHIDKEFIEGIVRNVNQFSQEVYEALERDPYCPGCHLSALELQVLKEVAAERIALKIQCVDSP